MRSPLPLLVALTMTEPRLQPVRGLKRLAATTTMRRKAIVIKGPSALTVSAAGEGDFVYSYTVGDEHRVRCGSRLVEVQTLRGGSTPERQRERRPLARFIAPALVWVVAAFVDYALWWKLGPAAAAAAAVAIATSRDRVIGGACGVAAAIAANRGHFVCFHLLLFFALSSHIAVTVVDPGFIHLDNALAHGSRRESGRWCDRCNAAKPLRTHHCRRCGACVARMDHHCIYAANCVGAGNHKQFILLLLYSGACAAHASFLFLFHLGCSLPNPTAAINSNPRPFISGGDDTFSGSVSNGLTSKVAGPSWFARRSGLSYWVVAGGMSSLAILSWLLIILAVQLYGVVVDAGTIDRMQQAAKVTSSSGEANKAMAVGGVQGGLENETPPYSSACNPTPAAAAAAAADTTCAATGVFRSVVDLPRGPAAAASSSGGVDSELEGGSWMIGRRAACCVRSWKTFREETLGDGPWLMWFVPSRAKLSPEIERRLYRHTL